MTSATLPAVRPPVRSESDVCSNEKSQRLMRQSMSEERLITLMLAILDYYTSHRWLVMSEAMIDILHLVSNSAFRQNRGYTRMYLRLCKVVEQDRLHEQDEAIREAVTR